MTFRHPSVLAAEAVTVDHVSGGRLEIALGAAWNEQEHRQLGIDSNKRLMAPGNRPIDIVRGGEVMHDLIA